MAITKEKILVAWQNSTIVEGFDPKVYRKDACGAWIVWDKYGVTDNIYGWQVDHIVPQSMLEGIDASLVDDNRNLRALQHQNNASKGNDYPAYTAVVTSELNKNVQKTQNLVVNEKTREILKKLYNL